MKVHPLSRANGHLFVAFEIDRAYMGLSKVGELLESLEQVVEVEEWGRNSSDIRLKFKYSGAEFCVWEPFGDNGRYWIGPIDESADYDIEPLTELFETYRPGPIAAALGNILTLNFRSN